MTDQRQPGGRTGTWQQPGAAGVAAPWLPRLSGLRGAAGARLRAWLEAEVAPGRLMPWLPVAFGAGILVYFAADREPVWWVAAGLATFIIVLAFLARARPVAFPVAVGCAAIVAGFATAAIKSRVVDHPVLARPAYSVSIAGFVDTREERERSDRIVMRVTTMEGRRLPRERPDRIRLTVRKGTAPPVGAFIALRARLNPPASPFRPGGYDLARDLYFQGIGATGLALGRIEQRAPPVEPGWRLRFATAIESIRDAIDGRIRAAVPGDSGSIASALITGKRDALSSPVFDAMYISGVGHVLSVSGYHMALVAAVVLFTMRGTLALVPGLALRYPIKKWAAGVALAAATFYLVLSGAEVATQRSFIMIAVVLLGVMLDRPTLTMRTIAAAAIVVMLLVPEAVVHPSFQMSFAATLALIATYEKGIPWLTAGTDTRLGARIALWGAREVMLSLLVSVMAGLATTPFAAYHFHRMAPYGAIANLLAMPVISAISMPAGLLALLAMPFGFDAPLWRLMGAGIDWMTKVALWVTSLPGAVGRIPAFGDGALLLATAALIWICLLRSPLRFAGAGLAVAACVAALMAGRPDVMVSGQGDVVAVRGRDGLFTVIKFGSDTISVQDWLASDGDGRVPTDRAVAAGFSCDPDGCVAPLKDGAAVAVTRAAAGVQDDCARAALIVTLRTVPAGCAAKAIDRKALRDSGAIALTYQDGAFTMTQARPDGLDRPWAHPYHPEAARNRFRARRPLDATPLQPDADSEQ